MQCLIKSYINCKTYSNCITLAGDSFAIIPEGIISISMQTAMVPALMAIKPDGHG
jgi:hypothetical protein